MSKKSLSLIGLIIVATVGASLLFSHFCWFKRNEHVALWLEGIALVLIFALDYVRDKREHAETMEQIGLTRKQYQQTINSERAWLTANIDWADSEGGLLFQDSRDGAGNTITTTVVLFRLNIRNDGRTPAWIENISTGMEICGEQKQPEMGLVEHIEPIGADKARDIRLTLTCPGKPKMLKSETLCVHVTIKYHDIFESRGIAVQCFIEPLTKVIHGLESKDVNSIGRS